MPQTLWAELTGTHHLLVCQGCPINENHGTVDLNQQKKRQSNSQFFSWFEWHEMKKKKQVIQKKNLNDNKNMQDLLGYSSSHPFIHFIPSSILWGLTLFLGKEVEGYAGHGLRGSFWPLNVCWVCIAHHCRSKNGWADGRLLHHTQVISSSFPHRLVQHLVGSSDL